MKNRLHQSPSWIRITCLLSVLALWTSPTRAQEANEDEEIFELSPFEVDASDDMGYYASQTLAGGRLSTDIINTGSSIEVITADFMDDIGANDIQELLQYTTNTEIGGNLGNFTGISVDTSQGNVDAQSGQRNPDANSRIRGLASPDSTRDFFKTQIPFDQYNTERIDINRGSNSFLFGLGSPAGLINNQLSKAQFNNRTKLRFRVGSGGDRPSLRGEIDVNREIYKDRLAVRVAAMANRTQYRQRPTFRDDNRIYGTLTWHPFDNNKMTTIRAHWESGDIYSTAAATVLPGQAIDTWIRYRVPINVDLNTRLYRQQYGFNQGDVNANPDRFPIITEIDALRDENGVYGWWPTFEYLPNGRVEGGTFNRPGIDVIDNIGGAGYTLIYDGRSNDASFIMRPQPNGQNENFVRGEGSFRRVTINGVQQWIWRTDESGDSWWSPNGATSGNSQMRFYSNSRNYADRGVGWFKQGFTDLETFDFSKRHLAWDNDFWERDFYNYNVTLGHLFLEGKAGIEVAYDYQYSQHNTMTYFTAGGAEVQIDINQTIPQPQIDASGNVIYPQYDPETNLPMVDENGLVVGGAMPNPNYGRPFINSRRGDGRNRNDYTTLRATAFYKLNFEDYAGDDGWLRWLGEHTLSLLGDHYLEEYEGFGHTLRSFSPDVDVGLHVHDNSGISAVAGPRQVGRIAYIGPPVQSYLGDDVWDPTKPISMSDIILEPTNYNMNLASYQEGWSMPWWYWNRGTFTESDLQAFRDATATPANPNGRLPVPGTSDWIEGDPGDEHWAQGTLTPRMTPNEANQIRRTEVDSWAVNAQSFFFNRHLVVNTGYREDFIDSWLNREPPKSDFDQVPDLSPDVFRAEDGDYDRIDKGPSDTGTFGYGAVLHWPKNIIRIPESMDISFHYNFSENFIPDNSRRTISDDITLVRLPSPQGESKDYGVTFQLFDRRLIVRLNWYENILIGADGSVGNIYNQNLNKMFTWFGNNNRVITNLDSSTGTINGTYDGVISNQEELDNLRQGQLDNNGNPIYVLDEFGDPVLDEFGDPVPLLETDDMVIDREFPFWDETVQARNELYDLLFSGYWQMKERRNRIRLFDDGSIEQEDISAITDTEDLQARGFEASVTWNPTRNWRLSLNVARQETIKSNITPHLQRFIEEDWLPWVLKWGELDWNDSSGPLSGDTLAENVNENLIEYFTVKAQQGFPSDEVREWRVNMVTNYSFRDGPLDGFSFGGAMRWQSDAAIGYPLIEKEVIPDTYILVGDVGNPYYGDEQFSFDLQCGYQKRFKNVNWQIQLNLRNLQNIASDDIEILIAQPDGSAAKARWEPPFQWQITNTFRW